MPDEVRRDRQVPRIDQQVVDEAMPRQRGDPAAERRPQQEPVVRLALDDMAHADELPVPGRPLHSRLDVVGLQVHPADDAGDEGVGGGELQQPLGL